jgi:hypothetical protein
VITVADLAEQLDVDPGDVAVLAAQLGENGPELTDETGREVWSQLNHQGERTTVGLYWPGAEPLQPGAGQIGTADPTATD